MVPINFNPPQVAPEKSEDTQTGEFIEAHPIRLAKLLALAVAVTVHTAICRQPRRFLGLTAQEKSDLVEYLKSL